MILHSNILLPLPLKGLRIVPPFLYSSAFPVYKALNYKMKSPAPGYPASTWPLARSNPQTYGKIYSIVSYELIDLVASPISIQIFVITISNGITWCNLATYLRLFIFLDNIMFGADVKLENQEDDILLETENINEEGVSSRINFGNLGGFAGQVICNAAKYILGHNNFKQYFLVCSHGTLNFRLQLLPLVQL